MYSNTIYKNDLRDLQISNRSSSRTKKRRPTRWSVIRGTAAATTSTRPSRTWLGPWSWYRRATNIRSPTTRTRTVWPGRARNTITTCRTTTAVAAVRQWPRSPWPHRPYPPWHRTVLTRSRPAPSPATAWPVTRVPVSEIEIIINSRANTVHDESVIFYSNCIFPGKSQSDSSGVACHCKDYLWMKETTVTSAGCRLESKEYCLSLTVPEGAVGKSQKEPLLFALLQDEYKPILSGN